jgi:hypothetical protein
MESGLVWPNNETGVILYSNDGGSLSKCSMALCLSLWKRTEDNSTKSQTAIITKGGSAFAGLQGNAVLITSI